jgi:hypothetical protein
MNEMTETTRAEKVLREGERAALAEARHLARRIAADVARFIVRSLPALIRAVCVALGFGGAFVGFYWYWLAFGANESAAIPALLFAIYPLVWAIGWRVQWGGLLISGAATLSGAAILSSLEVGLSQLIVVVMLAALVISEMARRGQHDDKQPEGTNQ